MKHNFKIGDRVAMIDDNSVYKAVGTVVEFNENYREEEVPVKWDMYLRVKNYACGLPHYKRIRKLTPLEELL